MAVPKKKNNKVKYKYSINKKELKNNIKERIMSCIYCNLEIKKKYEEKDISWFGYLNSKKKICVYCINKIIK